MLALSHDGVLALGCKLAVQFEDVCREALLDGGERARAALDLADSWQEDEDIALAAPDDISHGGPHGILDAGIAVLRAVFDFDRERSPLALDHGCIGKEPGDGCRVQCGGHDHDAQVFAHGASHALREGEGEVGGETPLMELIEDDGPDTLEQRVVLQHA